MASKVLTQLMFTGQAGEAIALYTSLFPDSVVVRIDRYGPFCLQLSRNGNKFPIFNDSSGTGSDIPLSCGIRSYDCSTDKSDYYQ